MKPGIKAELFLPVAAFPVLLALLFMLFGFALGNPGFKLDKTQHGLRVSEVYEHINPVHSGDLIVAINGLSYGQTLGFLFAWPQQPSPGSFTLDRNGERITLPLKTIPYTPASLLKIIWPHLLLILVLLMLGIIALRRSPLRKVALLFFVSLCGFSSAIAFTLASNMGLMAPPVQSLSFFGVMISNWLSFSAFLHFVFRFPTERDLIKPHPRLLPLFYFAPPAVILLIAVAFSGVSWDFWGWLQRFRNLFLPLFIFGIFFKHLVDYIKLPAPEPARNQIKLPLLAFWLSFGPYLFLYLIPNLIFNQPVIYFRTVILAFLALPVAYLIALLRYRLFDIDKMLSKIIAYVVIIIVATGLYALFIVTLKRWLYGQNVLSEQLFLVFLLLVITLINPAANRLQKIINRVIFGNTPVQAASLHRLSRRIGTALQVSDLVQAVTVELPEYFGLNKAAIVIIDRNGFKAHPAQAELCFAEHTNARQVIELFEGDEDYFRYSPMVSGSKQAAMMQKCGQSGWSIIFKLRGAGALIGLLFLGHKRNGRLLNDEDIHLLATLANHTGVALENGLRYERLVRSKKQQEATLDKLIQAEKMAAIGEMTITLAHELKNPLAIIRGSAQYVAEGQCSAELTREMLDDIIDEVDTLNLTINSLLKLARHRPPVIKAVDPVKAILSIIKKWQHSDDHKPGIAIYCECDLPDPPPMLHCDIGQLGQIILNLIRNAEEAMGHSGKIDLRVSRSGDDILIKLSDTGPGIEAHLLSHIFEHFFSTKNSGAGLGLAVCKQLVQAHRGSISIKNNENGGAVVLLLLPFEVFAPAISNEV